MTNKEILNYILSVFNKEEVITYAIIQAELSLSNDNETDYYYWSGVLETIEVLYRIEQIKLKL